MKLYILKMYRSLLFSYAGLKTVSQCVRDFLKSHKPHKEGAATEHPATTDSKKRLKDALSDAIKLA